MRIRISAKIPKLGIDRKLIEQIRDQELKETHEDFQKTCQNWSHKPEFKITRYGNQNATGGYVGYDTGTENGRIYNFIDEGTAHRHAAMDSKYDRRTNPKSLVSSGSGGKVAYINKNYEGISPDTGQPGITARDFSEKIADKHRMSFMAKVRSISGRIIVVQSVYVIDN